MNTYKLKCQRLCFFSCQGCRRSVSSFTPSCLCHVPRHRLTLIPCRLQVSDLFEWIWSVVRPHDVFILLNEKRDAMNFTNGGRRPSTHADSLSFKAFIVLQSFTLIKPTKNKERKLQRVCQQELCLKHTVEFTLTHNLHESIRHHIVPDALFLHWICEIRSPVGDQTGDTIWPSSKGRGRLWDLPRFQVHRIHSRTNRPRAHTHEHSGHRAKQTLRSLQEAEHPRDIRDWETGE